MPECAPIQTGIQMATSKPMIVRINTTSATRRSPRAHFDSNWEFVLASTAFCFTRRIGRVNDCIKMFCVSHRSPPLIESRGRGPEIGSRRIDSLSRVCYCDGEVRHGSRHVEYSNQVMPCDWETDVPCSCMICCANLIPL